MKVRDAMEYLLTVAAILGILGVIAWLIEGPIGRRVSRWRQARHEERISYDQSNSERGL